MDNATVFFTKSTNRELYKYRNILEYQDGKYVLTNPISENNIREMRNNMDDSDLDGFNDFLQRNWGIAPKRMEDYETKAVTVSANTELEKTAKRRGRKPKTQV